MAKQRLLKPGMNTLRHVFIVLEWMDIPHHFLIDIPTNCSSTLYLNPLKPGSATRRKAPCQCTLEFSELSDN